MKEEIVKRKRVVECKEEMIESSYGRGEKIGRDWEKGRLVKSPEENREMEGSGEK